MTLIGVEAYGINEPKIIKRRRRKIIVKNDNEEVPKNFRKNITSFQLSMF